MNAFGLLLTGLCIVGLVRDAVPAPTLHAPPEGQQNLLEDSQASRQLLPSVDINATSTSHATNAQEAADIKDAFLLKPAPLPDGKPHDLIVGKCDNTDPYLHAERIVVNNDGKSRVLGDVRVNVEAQVNITCFKVLDMAGTFSGAFPSYLTGGLGHNYVIFEFDAAYGYGINFLVELYGVIL